jgi:hypothetical protein
MGVVIRQIGMIDGDDAIDFADLLFFSHRVGIGAQNHSSNRLVKIAGDALGKNEQFACNGLQLVVFVFGYDDDH